MFKRSVVVLLWILWLLPYVASILIGVALLFILIPWYYIYCNDVEAGLFRAFNLSYRIGCIPETIVGIKYAKLKH